MTSHPTRRSVLIATMALATSPAAGLAQPAAKSSAVADPKALVTAIYARAARGKGDSGGQFLWLEARDRAKSFSRDLVALWARADKATPDGDQGPMGFDPVTNSQDPSVKSFTVAVERQDASSAIVAVRVTSGYGTPQHTEDQTIRYDLVADNAAWKIDDIRGSVDGTAWSVRTMLADHIASNRPVTR